VADGIRIQPQPARLKAEGIGSAAHRLFILRDQSRPLTPDPNRHPCETCGQPHEFKTYHLQLDAEGTTIVSTGVWEKFLSAPDHFGFEQVNVVAEPPAQGIKLEPVVLNLKPAKLGTKKG